MWCTKWIEYDAGVVHKDHIPQLKRFARWSSSESDAPNLFN